MCLARIAATACALTLACPAFLAGCGSDGSSTREGQSGAGEPATEAPVQTSPKDDQAPGQSPGSEAK